MNPNSLSFQEAENALSQLVLPRTGPNDAFYLSHIVRPDNKGLMETLRSLNVTEADLATPQDQQRLEQHSSCWYYRIHTHQGDFHKKVAVSLQDLLGNLGDATTQARALAAMEAFSPQFSLSLNDYEIDVTIALFVENHQEFRRGHSFLDGVAVLDQTPEDQAAYTQGLWTVHDHSGAPFVIAASGNPVRALLKAWAISPTMNAYRRQTELDQTLPEPKPPGFKPRF